MTDSDGMANTMPDNNTGPDDDTAWRAVLSRNRDYDGHFVTGVLSTGIYCRPSCAARHPRRENVRFFATPSQAREEGLRPCLRCHPDDVSRDEAALAEAVRMLALDEAITVEQVAGHVGYSPAHFQRLFKRALGLTPAAYARARRMERVQNALQETHKVTEAIYDAGYGSASRFYEASEARLGMTPSAWKHGGRGVAIHWAVVPTSMGAMLVAATGKGVCRLSFDESVEALAERFPHADLIEGGEDFAALLRQVIDAVERPGDARGIPLDVAGTAFQEAIWRELQRIPAGETRSYAQLATAVGKPKAMRAAGSANGANCVAVLIPCHRVVRTDGTIGGYAYGTDIKRELLRREGVTTEHGDTPDLFADRTPRTSQTKE
ncbi:bifunctional DNA-binding transcriptional regulator/O6-methylguanine-DNA methyltransferase Ada [Novosphingobium sp. 9]|uniref:bifunctional DNA-binding transcriptional regulator/O6-methylguanine-DNA methyltransferase Ada n=1 Tax=Novosphingobium sp. 9 TaxID=2025349 RepID=UPI0021B6C886|nr:bifunctional DNA-binding transcriptional regulator/O6-methylguanine-DNA methyltransferase Ada [Novosphingobium sp. 9]